MKTLIFTSLSMIFLFSVINSKAQKSVEEVEYKRSSLHMLLIESPSFPSKEAVMNSWNNYPFPDKYNNHTVSTKNMNPANYKITSEDRKAYGLKEKTVAGQVAGKIVDPQTIKEMQIKIDKHIKKTDLAKQLVAKWFNRNPEGNFDMNLIQKRGFYDASELDVQKAKGQARGVSALGDAGEKLINNTFVIFSKLKFVKNEPIAKAAKIAAMEKASEIKNPIAKKSAEKAAEKAYEKAKKGYSIWTGSWLYKLEWNDSTASVFYNNLWSNKEAFENSDLFELKFVGKVNSASLVTFSLKENRTKEELIDIATVRNIDNTLAKLQKEYEVFKPKVPVISTDPVKAKIGMKEGIEEGDKFEVLEIIYDSKKGVTKYDKACKVKVDKVWDNRYNAATEKSNKKTDKNGLDATIFKRGRRAERGMLLRQIK